MDPEDIASYTNRGEIYLIIGITDGAKDDFKAAIDLDKDGESPWALRAKILINKINEEEGEK